MRVTQNDSIRSRAEIVGVDADVVEMVCVCVISAVASHKRTARGRRLNGEDGEERAAAATPKERDEIRRRFCNTKLVCVIDGKELTQQRRADPEGVRPVVKRAAGVPFCLFLERRRSSGRKRPDERAIRRFARAQFPLQLAFYLFTYNDPNDPAAGARSRGKTIVSDLVRRFRAGRGNGRRGRLERGGAGNNVSPS